MLFLFVNILFIIKLNSCNDKKLIKHKKRNKYPTKYCWRSKAIKLGMKFSFVFIFFLFIAKIAFANEFKFEKIISLDKPWGSTFINDNKILLTEVGGKIKLVNIKSKVSKTV